MGTPNLIPIPRHDDSKGVIRAIQKLASLQLNADSTPTFAELTLTGALIAASLSLSGGLTVGDLTPSRLMFGDGSKIVDSVEDLTAWIAGTTDHIAVTDDADGTVTVDLAANVRSLLHTHNGTFIESIDFVVTENAGTLTGSLEQTGGGELTQVFSDGFFNLDTDPALTVDLTAYVGTDAVPKVVYVYILQSDKGIIAASNISWPETEHIKVADLILQSAVTTGLEDALGNRNHNDHAAGTNGQGHLSHIAERLRKEACHWESGVAISVKDAAGAELTTGNSSTAIELVTSEGVAYQLHDQIFTAIDMYVNAEDDVHVTNQPVADGGGFFATHDMVTDIVSVQDGTAIGVNKYFNLVIWGIQNKSDVSQHSHLMVNLPSDVYNIESQAVSDMDGTTIYDIPTAFKGTGFLIARMTFRKIGGSQWTYIALEDLRGQSPSITAGVAVSTTDHSLLNNLTADDHTQYFLADGTRAMTGSLDMGNQNIINPGTGHDTFTDHVPTEHLDHAVDNVESDLVVWLRMDDIDGSGNPLDLGTAENVWSNTGNVTQVKGAIGKAFNFDGSESYTAVSSPVGLPLGSESRTFSALVTDNGSDNNAPILRYGTGPGGSRWSVETSGGYVRLAVGAGNAVVSATTRIDDGRNHSIIITYGAGGRLDSSKLYVDGVFESWDNASSFVPDTDMGVLTVGGVSGADPDWNGDIDDVRLYSRELSEDEALELHELGTLDADTPFSAAYFSEYVASKSAYFNSLNASGDVAIGGDLSVSRLLDIGEVETAHLLVGGTSLFLQDVVMETALYAERVIHISERSVPETNEAGKGQLWVKDDTPNILMFTDDAGTNWEVQLNVP